MQLVYVSSTALVGLSRLRTAVVIANSIAHVIKEVRSNNCRSIIIFIIQVAQATLKIGLGHFTFFSTALKIRKP